MIDKSQEVAAVPIDEIVGRNLTQEVNPLSHQLFRELSPRQ